MQTIRAERATTNVRAISTSLRGHGLLRDPLINKGTAFTFEEREALGLTGLLPPRVKTLEQQSDRAYDQYRRQPDDLARYVYLTALRDRNEVLFYHLLTEHLYEMLPIVYTPTIAQAIERYSHEYRRPRGIFLSIDHPELVRESFWNLGLGPGDVDLVVATDGERILGIGDWGVGGIDIAVGKLDVYTAAAGIDPNRVVPVVLDVGTDRQELLDDPQYLGNRHPRVRGAAYDAFIDLYVRTASDLFPQALLHWEDFAAGNARRILLRYRDRYCTFNDDMQGTGAIVLAAVLSAMRVLGARVKDQRIVMFGAGTAGIGIAEQLRDAMVREGAQLAEAMERFFCLGHHGLITTDQGPQLRDFQLPYARPAAELSGWARDESGDIGLMEVVRRVQPTILIGSSTVPGSFTEEVVREMATYTERPIILPLSNPTAKCEADPSNLIGWTEGRALVATGSPFPPVTYRGVSYCIAQANNAFVFPGIGLGIIVARAARVTDRMLAAAAEAVAACAAPMASCAGLLPPVEDIRIVSAAVAAAVSKTAILEGVNRVAVQEADVENRVQQAMWAPVYPVVGPDPSGRIHSLV